MRDVVWFREGNSKSSYANAKLIFLNHYKEELKDAEHKVATVTKIINRLEEEGNNAEEESLYLHHERSV